MHNARDPDRNKEDKDMGWGCSGGMGGCDGEREKGGGRGKEGGTEGGREGGREEERDIIYIYNISL